MKRDAAQTIFRTVVFAGAMLGAGACGGKKPAPATPTNTTTETGDKAADPAMKGDAKPAASEDPCASADPCARPRGADADGGGGTGRGFILS